MAFPAATTKAPISGIPREAAKLLTGKMKFWKGQEKDALSAGARVVQGPQSIYVCVTLYTACCSAVDMFLVYLRQTIKKQLKLVYMDNNTSTLWN